jgi:hypothetical protein
MFDTHIKDGAVQFYVILMTCAGSLPTNFLKQLFHCRSLYMLHKSIQIRLCNTALNLVRLSLSLQKGLTFRVIAIRWNGSVAIRNLQGSVRQ